MVERLKRRGRRENANLDPGQPNARRKSLVLVAGVSDIRSDMVSTDRFRQEIRSWLEMASAQGRPDLTIECGELYRSVSKLPVFDPWMIFCCNAMRAEMATTDRLIFDDSQASLLTIRYGLPRHQRPSAKSN